MILSSVFTHSGPVTSLPIGGPHAVSSLHELNRVVTGLDNPSAPIFKTIGGIGVTASSFSNVQRFKYSENFSFRCRIDTHGLLAIYISFRLNSLDTRKIFQILHCLAFGRITVPPVLFAIKRCKILYQYFRDLFLILNRTSVHIKVDLFSFSTVLGIQKGFNKRFAVKELSFKPSAFFLQNSFIPVLLFLVTVFLVPR